MTFVASHSNFEIKYENIRGFLENSKQIYSLQKKKKKKEKS